MPAVRLGGARLTPADAGALKTGPAAADDGRMESFRLVSLAALMLATAGTWLFVLPIELLRFAF